MPAGTTFDNEKLKTLLLSENYLSEEDWQDAEKHCKDQHLSIVDYLIEKGLITTNLLGQAVAESMGAPYIDLNNFHPDRAQIDKIPAEFGQANRVIFISGEDKAVMVTTDSLDHKELTAGLQKIFPGSTVTIGYSLPEHISSALIFYRKPLETRFGKILEEKKKVAPEIIEQIIDDAVALRASDIHFEPQEQEVIIRFRIDGMLGEAGRLPKAYYDNILNRIKIQSRLRIDEHYAAQDGAMRHTKGGSSVDLRVSIVPTLDGEKIAIRILSEYVRNFTLADLGLSPEAESLLRKASRKPFGMILVVGPTGSGKTTTLYSLLKTLNSTDVNITSIEDPVEYKIAGVNQIQVNTQTNLSFAEGLRSIVRQDPNIILVGEIRDLETADISVNAALTGHLLLSTFHANDASSAMPRLLEMGVEPFLLASTLDIIVAKRLVRKICGHCRYSVTVKISELQKTFSAAKRYFSGTSVNLFKGKGCPNCNHTGYRDRISLFEIIPMTPELQALILERPSAVQIWNLAKKQGAISMFEDGIQKVVNGVTTIEELLRVVALPEK